MDYYYLLTKYIPGCGEIVLTNNNNPWEVIISHIDSVLYDVYFVNLNLFTCLYSNINYNDLMKKIPKLVNRCRDYNHTELFNNLLLTSKVMFSLRDYKNKF